MACSTCWELVCSGEPLIRVQANRNTETNAAATGAIADKVATADSGSAGTTWAEHANSTCLRELRCSSFACLCAPCAAYMLRNQVIGDNINAYQCFQGQVDTFDCKRGSGSVAAAAVEATCCAPCSIYISRAHHAMQHSFVPDPCDNRVQRCDNCFRNMECIRVAAAQLSGAGDDELRRLSVSLDEKQPLCGWGYLAYFLWWPCLYTQTWLQVSFGESARRKQPGMPSGSEVAIDRMIGDTGDTRWSKENPRTQRPTWVDTQRRKQRVTVHSELECVHCQDARPQWPRRAHRKVHPESVAASHPLAPHLLGLPAPGVQLPDPESPVRPETVAVHAAWSTARINRAREYPSSDSDSDGGGHHQRNNSKLPSRRTNSDSHPNPTKYGIARVLNSQEAKSDTGDHQNDRPSLSVEKENAAEDYAVMKAIEIAQEHGKRLRLGIDVPQRQATATSLNHSAHASYNANDRRAYKTSKEKGSFKNQLTEGDQMVDGKFVAVKGENDGEYSFDVMTGMIPKGTPKKDGSKREDPYQRSKSDDLDSSGDGDAANAKQQPGNKRIGSKSNVSTSQVSITTTGHEVIAEGSLQHHHKAQSKSMKSVSAWDEYSNVGSLVIGDGLKGTMMNEGGRPVVSSQPVAVTSSPMDHRNTAGKLEHSIPRVDNRSNAVKEQATGSSGSTSVRTRPTNTNMSRADATAVLRSSFVEQTHSPVRNLSVRPLSVRAAPGGTTFSRGKAAWDDYNEVF